MTLARVLTRLCAAMALTAAASGASHAASRADIMEIVVEEALATTVPPSLALAVAKVESDFQIRALGPKGARGVMQIMPATAEGEFGVAADKLWDARLNVRLGIDFLARLVKRLGGRWDLALSHYNSGRVVGTGARAAPLPATRKYVDSVLRWQRRYADQARVWRAAPARRLERHRAKTRVVRRTGSVWSRRLGERLRRPVAAVSVPAGRYRPGESFKDCKECPEMVAVPPGSFVMGSPAGEKGRGDGEGPRRRVVLAGALAVGKYEVTFAEWDACRADGGCDGHLPDDRGWGRGPRPVMAGIGRIAQSRKTGTTSLSPTRVARDRTNF